MNRRIEIRLSEEKHKELLDWLNNEHERTNRPTSVIIRNALRTKIMLDNVWRDVVKEKLEKHGRDLGIE